MYKLKYLLTGVLLTSSLSSFAATKCYVEAIDMSTGELKSQNNEERFIFQSKGKSLREYFNPKW